VNDSGSGSEGELMKRFFPFWCYPLILVLALMNVGLRLSIVKTTYEMNQMEKMIKNAKEEKEKSSILLAGLRSPKRLELLSKTTFNLSQPRADQIIYLK
jgi:fumarate reductase subunit C